MLSSKFITNRCFLLQLNINQVQNEVSRYYGRKCSNARISKYFSILTQSDKLSNNLLIVDVALSLSRFAKSCILRLTKKKLFFIVSEEESGPRRPLVWCELPVSFYFKEYNIVGVSDVHDEIYLELSTGRPRIFSLCL